MASIGRDQRSLHLLMRFLLLLSMLLGTPGCRGAEGDNGDDDSLHGLSGMFILGDDGRTQFTACHSRTMVPVAQSGDWPALKKAYQDQRTMPDEPILITVNGRVGVPENGANHETPHLLVDRFLGIWPGETCGRPAAVAQLRDMYWKLTRLEGRPVRVGANRREPHLVFHTQEERLAGWTGCNQIHGYYDLNGEGIALGRIKTTRMACPDAPDQERAFLDALGRVKTWRIEGQHLELRDKSGAPLLRFEERALTH
jgi:copper homeostasis protein (lipoprotein)